MALLQIKKIDVPKDATHKRGDLIIKDIGQTIMLDTGLTEVYECWHKGEWIPQFGRHLGEEI